MFSNIDSFWVLAALQDPSFASYWPLINAINWLLYMPFSTPIRKGEL